jgi:hypothetical protein
LKIVKQQNFIELLWKKFMGYRKIYTIFPYFEQDMSKRKYSSSTDTEEEKHSDPDFQKKTKRKKTKSKKTPPKRNTTKKKPEDSRETVTTTPPPSRRSTLEFQAVEGTLKDQRPKISLLNTLWWIDEVEPDVDRELAPQGYYSLNILPKGSNT